MYSTRGRASRRLADSVGAVLLDEVRRIEAVRHDHHHRLHRRESLLELGRTLGRAGARLVGVERHDRPLGEPSELPEVPFPQRRTAGRDRVLDARLREPDHIGIPLDHEHLAPLRDRRASPMQVVEDLVLLVDRRLGGVQVLGLLASAWIVRQDAGAEPDAVALQVVDREDHPSTEPVSHRAVVTPLREARLEQDLRAQIARLGEPPQKEVGIPGGVSDAEHLDSLGRDATLGHVRPGILGFLAVGQHACVELGGLLVGAEQGLPAGGGRRASGESPSYRRWTPACCARRSTAST